ncbi:MAG: biotin/lipoyl-containing protein [Candidatus Eisenbacteria bacterium]
MRTLWRDGDRIRSVELTSLQAGRWRVRADEAEFELVAERLMDGRLRLQDDHGTVVAEVSAVGDRRFVRLDGLDFVLDRERGGRRARTAPGHGLEAPMPGVVTRVLVKTGDQVTKGQQLIALEAMKMEHLIRAPRDGRVTSIAARVGELAVPGAPLVELEEDA